MDNRVDFSKIKLGVQTLTDAILTNEYKTTNPTLGDKEYILQAINNNDIPTLRAISDYFYQVSGIYSRLCRYMAYLYRYDWLVTPYFLNYNNQGKENKKNILKNFYDILNYLDEFGMKQFFGDTALKVIRCGSYYCYIIDGANKPTIQELPVQYCRSKFTQDGNPVVEMNMKYFDDTFRDKEYLEKVLNIYPSEFKKGYKLYKEGKLLPQTQGDSSGWYILDPKKTRKFNINNEDYPMLVSVIPAIIDLKEAQELDKKKMQQKLLKIIVQKLPLDNNFNLVFDVDEAKDLHNNAVSMLSKTIGVDILTTFAEVDVADMSDNATASGLDELKKVERTVYNEAGASQMLFNTDGNLALEKSVANDEAAMYNLLSQFEKFANQLITKFNKNNKKMVFKVQLLSTTIYNYKEMAKLYKEQMQLGYSKMLPQIALGQTQSSILANAYFENDILDLINVFLPPISSNTMNVEGLQALKEDKAGRPELDDDKKSTKTIQNKESM